ncbi:hypothetical protein REPUB_Repub11eG0190100 [Reevesia pubescens]
MEGSSNRDVNQETLNAPLLMSPSNESGNTYERVPAPVNQPITENQVLRGQGQRVCGNMDPKMLKRVAASRKYSQRHQLKQHKHVADLEAEVKALQAEVEINFPRVRYADSQNALLQVENGSMKQKLYVLIEEIMLKEVEYHELNKKKNALKKMSLMYQVPFGDIYQTNN